MMDHRYTFRAKSMEEKGDKIKIGDWVYGAYIPCYRAERNYSKFGEPDNIYPVIYVNDGFRVGFIRVDPNTVGRCVELRDIHSRFIFEGDIVEQKANIYKLGKNEPEGKYTRRGIVYWDDIDKKHAGHWAVETVDEKGNNVASCLFVGFNGWKHIGNIHDTLELLK